MKNPVLLLLTIIAVLSVTSCVKKQNSVAESDIHFFYLELCPGCDEYVMAEQLSESVSLLGGNPRNIIHDDDAQFMKKILTEMNLADISHSLPLLIVQEKYYVGYEEIFTVVEGLKSDQ